MYVLLGRLGREHRFVGQYSLGTTVSPSTLSQVFGTAKQCVRWATIVRVGFGRPARLANTETSLR